MSFRLSFRDRTFRLLAIMAMLAGLIGLLFLAGPMLSPFLVGIGLAFLMEPAVSSLSGRDLLGRRLPRWSAVAIIYFGLFIAVSLSLYGIGIGLSKTVVKAGPAFEDALERARDWLGDDADKPPLARVTAPPQEEVWLERRSDGRILVRSKRPLTDVEVRTRRGEVLLEVAPATSQSTAPTAPPTAEGEPESEPRDGAKQPPAGDEQPPADDKRPPRDQPEPGDDGEAGERKGDGDGAPPAPGPPPAVVELETSPPEGAAEAGSFGDYIRANAAGYLAWVTHEFERHINELIGLATHLVTEVLTIIFDLVLIFMIAAFISSDAPAITAFMRELVPGSHQEAYDDLVGRLEQGLSGVIRGQLMICLINGTLTGIGLSLFVAPVFIFPLVLIVTLLTLIPIFGTLVSSVPCIMIAMVEPGLLNFGPLTNGALMLGWLICIHLIESNILAPRIVGHHASIHPVLVIFALVVGGHRYGIVGALLGVAAMSIVQNLAIWVHDKLMEAHHRESAGEPSPGNEARQGPPRRRRRRRRRGRRPDDHHDDD